MPFSCADESGQQVPRVHLIMIEATGDRLRVGDSLTRHLGELLKSMMRRVSHVARQLK
jgi:heme oxygenase